MISQSLTTWISESESWQTFIDFLIPGNENLSYEFLKRPDDFYISLIGKLYDLLESDDVLKSELLAVAKGLEIYSLTGKRNHFLGVNQHENILYAASLYYLSDFSSSAYILANLFSKADFSNNISGFILEFLQRKPTAENQYSQMVLDFLATGNNEHLDLLLQIISNEKKSAFNNNPNNFTLFMIAETVIKKFRQDNIWNDLLEYNDPDHWHSFVSKAIQKPFPVWTFFPSQKQAIEKGAITKFNSLALRTPTSSGKTAICELIIYNEITTNPNAKILYLAPFRALAAELKDSFGRNLKRLGIKSRTIYGGDIPSAAQKQLIQDVSLLISTPEKFIALENTFKDFLDDFTLVICDEGHLLDDRSRGLNYELLLSRLKSNLAVKRRFVFISALIPNIASVNQWLGGDNESIVDTNYRATELEYAFLKPNPADYKNYYLDFNPFKDKPQRYELKDFLIENDFKFPGKRANRFRTHSFWNSIKTKAVACALKSLNLGSVALFTPNKGGNSGVAGIANEMLKLLDIGLNLPKPINFIKPNDSIVSDLHDYFVRILGKEYTLCKLIEIGALYHHGDLPQYVREVIEDSIREERIKLVICTNTLAEGVNLPIRTIVIYSTKRFNPETNFFEDIELGDLKNLVGRAGRAGKETKGLIIVTNPNDFGTMENVIKDTNLEQVNGQLYAILKKLIAEIEGRQLQIDNATLEAQDEKFKELIDSIDISIIDLLSEEIETENLLNTIQELFSETFARFQSTDHEAKVLANIVNLRGEKIKPFVDNDEFKFIKQSGSNLRLYVELMQVVNFQHPSWSELDDPTEDEWLNFIIVENVAKLPLLQYQLSEFNKINKTTLDFEDVKIIVKLWIQGNWFDTLSGYFDQNIDVTLRFVQSFISYHLQSACTAIIRNLQLRSVAPEFIPLHIGNFSTYLLHGLSTFLELELLELGFNDRMGIIDLAEIIVDDIGNIFDLEQYLIENRTELLNKLSGTTPDIVFRKLAQNFNYLALN